VTVDAQLDLDLEARQRNGCRFWVFEELRRAWPGWRTAPEIGRASLDRHGRMYSDSSITARIRDLRKQAHGGHTVEVRRRPGRRSCEYRLGGNHA